MFKLSANKDVVNASNTGSLPNRAKAGACSNISIVNIWVSVKIVETSLLSLALFLFEYFL